jgi:hypothetical protein
MSLTQSLLRYIPEPPVRLFVVLTVFAAVAVISFAVLADSDHESVVYRVPADLHSKG